jgi:hypothetical protein
VFKAGDIFWVFPYTRHGFLVLSVKTTESEFNYNYFFITTLDLQTQREHYFSFDEADMIGWDSSQIIRLQS